MTAVEAVTVANGQLKSPHLSDVLMLQMPTTGGISCFYVVCAIGPWNTIGALKETLCLSVHLSAPSTKLCGACCVQDIGASNLVCTHEE